MSGGALVVVMLHPQSNQDVLERCGLPGCPGRPEEHAFDHLFRLRFQPGLPGGDVAFLDVQGGQKSIQLVVCFALQSARMSWKKLADLEVQERQG